MDVYLKIKGIVMYVLFDCDKHLRLGIECQDWESAVTEASNIVTGTTMCVGIYWEDPDNQRLVVMGTISDDGLRIVKEELERNVWKLRRQIEEYGRLYKRLGAAAPKRFRRKRAL